MGGVLGEAEAGADGLKRLFAGGVGNALLLALGVSNHDISR
jgi:hypothetical protein